MSKPKKTFEEWLKCVDELLIKKTSLSHMDLPDCAYARWYEDGVTPSQAATKAIKNAKES